MKAHKKVLIVEDERSIREAIVDVLNRKGFLSIEAKNGKEGVKLALSQRPDLILLDLIMPEMDGMTALKKIREDAWGAHVPVIILTNVSATSEKLIDDMVTHRPLNYLIKSDWKIHDVVEKVDAILSTI